MRWLGPSLLVLGLVFSTGGVAIVGQAGSTADQTDAEQRSALPAEQSPAPQALPNECAPPGRLQPGAPAKLRGAKKAGSNKSIVLNTSGYNYALEGEWRPDPTAKPSGVPDGVLPNDADASPPAAPANPK